MRKNFYGAAFIPRLKRYALPISLTKSQDIEKIIKSGYQEEKLDLETADRLKRAFAVYPGCFKATFVHLSGPADS